MTRIKRITTDRAAPAGGHYSQGVVAGGWIFVSGQLPIAPDGAHAAGQDFAAQTRLAMTNLLAILDAGGAAPCDIVKLTAYIVGIENWPLFNAVYADMMGDARPARAVVPVPSLHHGLLVEVEALALAPGPMADRTGPPPV